MVILGNDISHLAPFCRKVQLDLRGNLTKSVDVLFEFSCHCYSRGKNSGEEIPLDLLIPDGPPKNPRNRVFDRARYEQSKGLVAMIDELIRTNGLVTNTPEENFFRAELIQTQEDGQTVSKAYFIFMHARVVAKPQRPKYIRVFIESAYLEDAGIPHPSGKEKRSFSKMLGKKWAP